MLQRCLILLCSFLLLSASRAQPDVPEPTPELDPARRQRLLRLVEVERLVASQPENAALLAERAQLCIDFGARTEAYSSVNRLERIAPQWPPLAALRSKADEMEIPEFEQISACLTQSADLLIRKDQPGAVSLFHLAELLLRDLKSAEIALDSLYVIRADALAERQRLDLARADYRAAIGPDGAITADSHVALGRALINAGQWDAALTELALVTSDAGLNFRFSRYWQAKAHLARHEKTPTTADAIAAYTLFTALAEEDPHDEDFVKGRDDALELVPKADRQKLRMSSPSRLAQAAALAKEGRATDARLILDGLLLRQPRLVEAYKARSALPGDAAHAEIDREIALELESPEPTRVTELKSGEKVSAVDLAVHARPYLSQPYLERARAKLRQPSPPNVAFAMSDARRATVIDPYDPEAFAVLAEATIAQKERIDFRDSKGRENAMAAATVAADRAVALAPDDTLLLVWRGAFEEANASTISRRQSGALRFYTRALRIDPASRPALLARARVSRQLARYSEAITDYQTYLKLVASDSLVRYELGVTQLLGERYEDAVATFGVTQSEFTLQSGNTSAESIEFTQMQAVALAAAGREQFEALAKAALARAGWSDQPEELSQHLAKKTPHAPQLDRLIALKSARSPVGKTALPEVVQLELDAKQTIPKK